MFSPEQVAALPSDANATKLAEHLTKAADESSWFEVGRPLSTANFLDILTSHQAVLAKEFSGLILGDTASPRNTSTA